MSLKYKPDITPRLWTPAEDQQLRHYRFEGIGRDQIAARMNRTPGSVDSRMRKLGLRDGKSSSRKWAERNQSQGPAGKPLDLGEGDHRYVEACRAQGGFTYHVRLRGLKVEVRI